MTAVSPDVARQSRAADADLESSATASTGVEVIAAAAHALLDARRQTGASLALAVSGGADSMVLMHAVAQALSATERCQLAAPIDVVTFDHGTGPHATRAAALVAEQGKRLGFRVRVGHASLAGASEAEWRDARWRFFRQSARPRAVVVTAHTRDDQVETVVMRVLRGAGARGIAGLAAPTPGVERPLLRISRDVVRRYAADVAIPFVEDPSNASRQHLRNRIRHDLLPAIRQVRPLFEGELLALAERAAEWRADVDDVAAAFVSGAADDGTFRVARGKLATYDSAVLRVLWPAIAARGLVTLDRRGTLRLAQFTSSGASGSRIQLSGGVEVIRHRDSFVLRRAAPGPAATAERSPERSLAGVVEFGSWRFQPVAVSNSGRDDPWTCDLPGDRPLSVREWRPADRMRGREGGSARRVKRFFGDAHIPGPSRTGWPVVLVDDEIVWIPGVRRVAAVPERSGRPVVRYACERFVSRHPGN